MIQGKLLSFDNDLSEVYKIWKEVFGDEPWISRDTEQDKIDNFAIYGLVYCGTDHKAVAAGRLVYDGIICRMDKIAVLKEYRGQKYGDFIVKMLLNKAFTAGVKEIALTAEPSTEGFFKNIGFKRLEDTCNKNQKEYSNMVIRSMDINKLCSKSVKK